MLPVRLIPELCAKCAVTEVLPIAAAGMLSHRPELARDAFRS